MSHSFHHDQQNEMCSMSSELKVPLMTKKEINVSWISLHFNYMREMMCNYHLLSEFAFLTVRY